MKRTIFIHVVIMALLMIPLAVHGQSQTVPTQTSFIKIQNPFKGGDNIMDLIVVVLNNIVMPIAAVASVIYIILAGFKYVMAEGNPTEITKANRNLLYALIGVGILLGAAGISKVIQNTVNSFITSQ